jgi:hypothetical protein
VLDRLVAPGDAIQGSLEERLGGPAAAGHGVHFLKKSKEKKTLCKEMARPTRYLSTIWKNKKAAQLAAYKRNRLSTDFLLPTTISITDASAVNSLPLQRGTA